MATNKKRQYKFVVDCKPGNCDTVQAYMKEIGFRVAKNDTSLGDHYGVMSFATERAASSFADEIFAKFAKKVRQIAVLTAR